AIVVDMLDRNLRHSHAGQLDGRDRGRRLPFQRIDAGRRRTHVRLGDVQRESTAFPGGAAQLDFASEQTGEFAADGQSEAGSAVLAAGARVSLLESFENDSLLFARNTDAGIGDL